MSIPLTIEFRHLDATPALEDLIRKQFARIEKRHADALRGNVVVDIPQHRQRTGKPVTVGIHVTHPGGVVDTHHEGTQEDAYVTIREAFDIALRQLDSDAQIRRGDVKRHTADAR
ncbi:HPF/RaiA family ribosome-associated protein [Solimonas variicoloris]|uniref:HPF/RaiA family ribosome-associated protein n=1 Tax=Solimonas variicoloris TaxID=254408 RepID=UPI000365377D|nr:HPF/RaiA family ribosome-associated protein [Solimonas variicoloris]